MSFAGIRAVAGAATALILGAAAIMPAVAQSDTIEALASPSPIASAPATLDAPPEPTPVGGRVVEIVLTRNEITLDGEVLSELAVESGETITFQVTNDGGVEHDFHIGPRMSMITGAVDELPGVPAFLEGTKGFTWVVPEETEDLRFGCVVKGHYTYMNGKLVSE